MHKRTDYYSVWRYYTHDVKELCELTQTDDRTLQHLAARLEEALTDIAAYALSKLPDPYALQLA